MKWSTKSKLNENADGRQVRQGGWLNRKKYGCARIEVIYKEYNFTAHNISPIIIQEGQFQ